MCLFPKVQKDQAGLEELLRGFEAAGLAFWTWDVGDDSFTMDERHFALWGISWKEHLTFEDLSEHIHPSDRDRVRAGAS